MEYLQYVWLAVLIVAAVVEALTTQLVAIWFAPGALVAMILAFCSVSPWIQLPVFIVLTVAFLFLGQKVFKKMFKFDKEKFNVDAVIGERCLVTERVDNLAGAGAVKVKGLQWAARSLNEGEIFEVGDTVEVIAVEGVKLICKLYRGK
ncbi:MAG: NfeD family protein [Clostridia bacterium]|nr:NfeD family protein [Clostridia bacterium]